MEAFSYLFRAFNMTWAIPIIAAVTTFGALGMMSTWVIGPCRGILATAEDGDLPPIFHKTNKEGMPISILITQAIIVTFLSLVFLLMPTVSSSYWALLALSSMLYMVMYILMFISAIILRYKHPHVPRAYKIPFGNIGMWVVATLGILGSGFGLFVGFLPPSQIDTGKLIILESFLVGGMLFFTILPLVIYRLRKPSWVKAK
jgi:amino acid transporter